MAKDNAAAESAAPKKSKKVLVIAMAVVLILAIAGGAAGVMMMGGKGKKGRDGTQAAVADGAEQLATVLVPFEEKFTVNIQSEDGSPHYLQVPRIELEVANEDTAKSVEAVKSKLSDRISSLLRQKTMQEMMVPGSDLKLKEDLKRVINEALGVRAEDVAKKGVTEVILPASFIVQ